MPPEKRSRAFPTGNALLYILLLSVVLIASFTSSAILNDLFAICNSRLLPTNQIVNCEAGCVLFRAHPVFVSSWLGVRQNASPQLLIGFFRHRFAPFVGGSFTGHSHCQMREPAIGWNLGSKMAPPLPLTASPWRTNTATPRHSGQSWTGCCITSPWSMPSLCWVVRLSIIFPLAVATADWKIHDIKNTAPPWRRRSQSGAVFNEGEMKGISGYRSSSNCSTVTVALPSAAKVMPSAD